jgi:hypothetical protein
MNMTSIRGEGISHAQVFFLIVAMLLSALISTHPWAKEARIVARPLTFQEEIDFGLPEGTQVFGIHKTLLLK